MAKTETRHAYPPVRVRAALAVLLITAVAACRDTGSGQPRAALSPTQFVEIVVEIREAEREALAADSASAAFRRQKAEILERHRITDDHLREFVRVHSGDFRLMSAVWDSITQRLKYVPPRHDPRLEPSPAEPDLPGSTEPLSRRSAESPSTRPD